MGSKGITKGILSSRSGMHITDVRVSSSTGLKMMRSQISRIGGDEERGCLPRGGLARQRPVPERLEGTKNGRMQSNIFRPGDFRTLSSG